MNCEWETTSGCIWCVGGDCEAYVLVYQPVRIVCLFTDRLAFADEYKQERTRLSAI